MARGAPRVPLVVLPGDGEVRRAPRLATGSRRRLATASRSLGTLRRALDRAGGRERGLDRALARAAEAMHGLAASLRPHLPERLAEATEPAVPVHEYFGVRQAPLAPEQHAAQTAAVLDRALADLAQAPVDLNDVAAEVDAMAAVLRLLEGGGRAPAPAAAGRTRLYRPRGDGMERWILVHHLYFLLNLHAAAAVREACAAIRAGADPAAVRLLDEARTHVRGMTAVMLHSGAVSAGYYRDRVRWTMAPPAVPVLLTGLMQPEHASYRAAMEELLEASPEPFLALVRGRRELAFARDALLEADLLDIERHVGVAAALVGDDRSLVQHEQAPENAISTLRRMRHARAARYCAFMRFGDRLVAAAPALAVAGP